MRYSQYFNKKSGKRGHLWQDRYYSCPLDDDHLYEVLRYIENNPVRAGIVESAEKYRWSSAKAHISTCPSFPVEATVLNCLGKML